MRHPTREPSLNELLDDPIAQLLMERDGVEEREVRKLLDDARQHHARTEPIGDAA
jgi:hypothetical protein